MCWIFSSGFCFEDSLSVQFSMPMARQSQESCESSGRRMWRKILSLRHTPRTPTPHIQRKNMNLTKHGEHYWTHKGKSTVLGHILVLYVDRKRAEYGFGEYGFNHRTQWVFWPSPSAGARAQWVPLSLLFVCQSELTEFFAELTEFAVELSEAQWVLFSETVLSKQYSARCLVEGSGFQNDSPVTSLAVVVFWALIVLPGKEITTQRGSVDTHQGHTSLFNSVSLIHIILSLLLWIYSFFVFFISRLAISAVWHKAIFWAEGKMEKKKSEKLENTRNLAASWVAANFLLFFPYFPGWPSPIFLLLFMNLALGPKHGSLLGRRGCSSMLILACCAFCSSSNSCGFGTGTICLAVLCSAVKQCYMLIFII